MTDLANPSSIGSEWAATFAYLQLDSSWLQLLQNGNFADAAVAVGKDSSFIFFILYLLAPIETATRRQSDCRLCDFVSDEEIS